MVTVQSLFNITNRSSDAVVDYCTRQGIGFIPWYPLAGSLARPGSALDTIAHRHNAAPSQVALAWLLRRSPVMLPIPGTGKAAHLEENVGAAAITLSDEEFATLDSAGREAGRRVST